MFLSVEVYGVFRVDVFSWRVSFKGKFYFYGSYFLLGFLFYIMVLDIYGIELEY